MTLTPDSLAYARPRAEAVAALVASHGMDAAQERWHHLDPRTLAALAQAGRAKAGTATTVVRRLSYTPEQAFVCVEAAFALRSQKGGEHAARIEGAVIQNLLTKRGLDLPLPKGGRRLSPEESDARDAHWQAVGDVLRAAYRLVPDQPATGRHRLPEPGPDLAAALVGCEPAAVAVVFPSLDTASIPSEQESPVQTETAMPVEAAPARRRGRKSSMPPDGTVRADHLAGALLRPTAERYGVHHTTLYAKWKALELDAVGRTGKHPAEEARPERVVAVATSTEAAAIAAPVPASLPVNRLDVEDLLLAARLVARGVAHGDAVRLVRADRGW